MSASFFDSILCCCLRQNSVDETTDENRQLLPQVEDGPSILSYDSTTFDHQKAKERLHVIVKAKEGKMVRVLSRVPFNLRNDPTNGAPNASSSRSNRSPSTNVSYGKMQAMEQCGAENDSQVSSSKPLASPSVSRSESASSVQRGSISHVSTDDLSDPFTEHKLKVQLITTAKNRKRAYSRRGRSKTKHGRVGDDTEATEHVPTLEGIQSVDSGRGDLDAPDDFTPIRSGENADPLVTSNGAGRPQVTPLSDEENDEIKAISGHLSPILKEDFADIGTLTRSWGD